MKPKEAADRDRRLKAIKEKERRLAALLRDVRRLTRGGEEAQAEARRRDAEHKREVRAAARDLKIPAVADAVRRAAAEADVFRWLPTYFPETFYGPFTEQRQEMVTAIRDAARYGGDQAIAAPRGEGKTTIAECVALFLVLLGLVKFPLIAAATGPDAQRILEHLKGHLERNELLAADYPEVCYPILALAGAAQRAGSQTVDGERTWLKWAQDHVVLPTVAGSKASGAVIMTRGLDAAIKGIRVGTVRPDLILIDDPETRESVESERLTDKRRVTIEEDLGGLGGPDKRLSRVMLTTLMRRDSLSAEYTDSGKKPSWKGRRFKMLITPPAREDLWEEYQTRRQNNFRSGDQFARGAHAFYLENREAMDVAAAVGNPTSYNAELLPDGSQTEVSTLQRCYNLICDRGWEHFATEYQNDPPEESGPIESGITPTHIRRQLSDYPQGVVPPGCTVLTQGIDPGKYTLWYVVKAWKPDATAYVIDYGSEEVLGTEPGTDEATDRAIVRALFSRREAMQRTVYRDSEGRAFHIDRTLVDAGYRTPAIYHFTREAGLKFQPAMGFGKSSGCVQTQFSAPARATRDKRPGDGWFLSRRPKGVWLVCMDADGWKAWEHDRWMTPRDQAGTCLLWGEAGIGDQESADQKAHRRFSNHICAEVEVEEPIKGKGMVRRWLLKHRANHLLDASYMADVAASMEGITLMAQSTPAAVTAAREAGWFGSQERRRRR